MADGRHLLGSCLFCLALNHKQMALYYAPAFFAHLLGCALRLPTLRAKARRGRNTCSSILSLAHDLHLSCWSLTVTLQVRLFCPFLTARAQL